MDKDKEKRIEDMIVIIKANKLLNGGKAIVISDPYQLVYMNHPKLFEEGDEAYEIYEKRLENDCD